MIFSATSFAFRMLGLESPSFGSLHPVSFSKFPDSHSKLSFVQFENKRHSYSGAESLISSVAVSLVRAAWVERVRGAAFSFKSLFQSDIFVSENSVNCRAVIGLFCSSWCRGGGMGPTVGTAAVVIVASAGVYSELEELDTTSCSSATLGVERFNLSIASSMDSQKGVDTSDSLRHR